MTTQPSKTQPADFYRADQLRPQADFIAFRCFKPMAMALRTRAIEEKVDVSQLIRRLLAQACEAEGIRIDCL